MTCDFLCLPRPAGDSATQTPPTCCWGNGGAESGLVPDNGRRGKKATPLGIDL